MASHLFQKYEHQRDYDNYLREQFGKCCWTCHKSVVLLPWEHPDHVKKECAVCTEYGHVEENPRGISEEIESCWE